METVSDYVEQMDRLLSAGAAMFPDNQPTVALEPVADPAPISAPHGSGGLADGAQQAGASYRDVDARIDRPSGEICRRASSSSRRGSQEHPGHRALAGRGDGHCHQDLRRFGAAGLDDG